jgi:predicted TIM-barrel fold metal-dependent hydrolase
LARPVINDGAPYAKAQSLWDIAGYKNIYLKLTSRTVEHCQQGQSTPEAFMAKVLSTFGAKRVLWGSNFPAHDDTLKNIVDETLHVLASVSDADRAQILSGTALDLYPSLK